jgi:fibro-slime domain-containing protein
MLGAMRLGLMALLGGLATAACGSSGSGAAVARDSGAPQDGGGSGGGSGGTAPDTGTTGGAGGGDAATGGTSGAAGQGGGASPCDRLAVTIRDFTEAHPDFESFQGQGLRGIVEATLGADRKPVYAHPGPTDATTGPERFIQWYDDVPSVNIRIPFQMEFSRQSNGLLTYDNPAFFPIDDQGFGNGPTQPAPNAHNFLFTTEIHTSFTYRGGEIFSFRGDDDLWVFVNGTLAIDLGGVHPAVSATADFDELAAMLGLVPGNTYPIDIFHAERHTTESNFRVDTSVDCFTQ